MSQDTGTSMGCHDGLPWLPWLTQMSLSPDTWGSGEAAGKGPAPSTSSTSSTSCLSEETERRSTLSTLARAPSRLEKLYWEPIGFFTTLMSLAELNCGGGVVGVVVVVVVVVVV